MMPVNEKLRSRQMVDNLRKAVGCSHPLYHFVQSLKEVASGVRIEQAQQELVRIGSGQNSVQRWIYAGHTREK